MTFTNANKTLNRARKNEKNVNIFSNSVAKKKTKQRENRRSNKTLWKWASEMERWKSEWSAAYSNLLFARKKC